MFCLVCMVGGEYKQGVVEPWLPAGFLKKQAQGVVRIAYATVYIQVRLCRIGFLIPVRYMERMV